MGASDVIARGEIWKNGSFWKMFGAPVLYSSGASSAAQISAAFMDSIPDNSAPITYSLYGTCFKTGGVTASYAAFNWGPFGGVSIGGGPTASYLKITERVK